MRAYLLLAHGSRQKNTIKTMQSITDKVKSSTGIEAIRYAFMQFAHPNFEKGLSALIENGATDILIVPYFLFDGVHMQEDIPQMMRAFEAEHPQVTLSLGTTLGEDDRLASIIAEQITQVHK